VRRGGGNLSMILMDVRSAEQGVQGSGSVINESAKWMMP
jgi:hypothetical protein